MGASLPAVCFAVIVPGPRAWLAVLSTAFTHPWVSSYQIGFGPPLVRAHDRLIAAVARANSALQKLEAYLEHCYLDDGQRRRLAQLHRRLLVRRHGPLEAELIRAATPDVLDLTVQLYAPGAAPGVARADMRAMDALPGIGPEDPPQNRTGRFWIHLADPCNLRLMEVDAVKRTLTDSDTQAVLALTVPPPGAALFERWLKVWTPTVDCAFARLEGPVSVARAYRDGVGV